MLCLLFTLQRYKQFIKYANILQDILVKYESFLWYTYVEVRKQILSTLDVQLLPYKTTTFPF